AVKSSRGIMVHTLQRDATRRTPRGQSTWGRTTLRTAAGPISPATPSGGAGNRASLGDGMDDQASHVVLRVICKGKVHQGARCALWIVDATQDLGQVWIVDHARQSVAGHQ